jgi:hypothetical protein
MHLRNTALRLWRTELYPLRRESAMDEELVDDDTPYDGYGWTDQEEADTDFDDAPGSDPPARLDE